mgnify:CR=1 FL=1
MAKKKGALCYAPIVQKIKDMDMTISDMKLKIEELKNTFGCSEEELEVCPDEIESELAMMEIMRDVYISTIADEEPEGDA